MIGASQGLQITQIAADLDVLIALEHNGGAFWGFEVCEQGAQLRGGQHGLALLPNQVREVYVDEPNAVAFLGIAREALPGQDIAPASQVDDHPGLPI